MLNQMEVLATSGSKTTSVHKFQNRRLRGRMALCGERTNKRLLASLDSAVSGLSPSAPVWLILTFGILDVILSANHHVKLRPARLSYHKVRKLFPLSTASRSSSTHPTPQMLCHDAMASSLYDIALYPQPRGVDEDL